MQSPPQILLAGLSGKLVNILQNIINANIFFRNIQNKKQIAPVMNNVANMNIIIIIIMSCRQHGYP